MQKDAGPREVACKVCGDKASGRHYGVPSCDGCRGFFKRSIRRNLDYVCKESGECVVDVTRRNQCQACRFKKCLQVHMKRDAVQHERAPRSSGPHHRRPDNFPTSSEPEPEIRHHTLFRSLATGYCPGFKEFPPFLVPNPPGVFLKRDTADDGLESPSSSSSSAAFFGPVPHHSHGHNHHHAMPPVPFGFSPVESPYECAAKLLFFSVKWSRSIPSFLQLPFRDQAILLEEAWCELFVLNAAQWNLPVDEGMTNGCAPTANRQAIRADTLRVLRDIAARFNSLRVDHTEYTFLKGLVLFKSEACGLRDPLQVELLQDQTHVMLLDHTLTRHPESKLRFGRLLLLLPAVRNVSALAVEDIFFRKTVGSIPIERLLCDMFKSS